jgi:hypothetical protein
MYDDLSNMYDQLRIKAVSIVVGEIAVAAILVSLGKFTPPTDYYQLILWVISLLLFAGSFIILLWTISSLDWLIPTDIQSSKNVLRLYPTEKEHMEYIFDEYVTCINYINPRISKRSKAFNLSLYLLLSSVILLIVTFGGKH